VEELRAVLLKEDSQDSYDPLSSLGGQSSEEDLINVNINTSFSDSV
jgi:hypothetical protein